MLREFIRKHKNLYAVAVKADKLYRKTLGRSRFLSWVTEYLFRYPYRRLSSFLRGKGLIKSRKYSKLKQFEKIHPGKRCFIICTGPSLRLDDLEKLKDEICFSMNSMVKLFDKTSWRPTYYAANGDKDVVRLVDEAIKNGELQIVFMPSVDRKKYTGNKSVIYTFPLINSKKIFDKKAFQNSDYKSIKNNIYRFSANPYIGFSAGASVTNVLIGLAIYMGFKEIYLIGCDCNFQVSQRHHPDVEYGDKWGESFTGPELLALKMIIGFEKAREYSDVHGVEIYNATRGGKLEVFKRVDIDDVLANDNLSRCN